MDIEITYDNVADYPVGTTVEFCWGAYHPTVEGVVTGFDVVTETEWNEEYVRLTATYVDPELDELTEATVRRFSDKGVGARLIEIANVNAPNQNSPWYKTS